MKRAVSLTLLLLIVLCAVLPVFAHDISPSILPPLPYRVCPNCGNHEAKCIIGSLTELSQGDMSCPYSVTCRVHYHKYKAEYKCPACPTIFPVNPRYEWHTTCGRTGWYF